jgi:hypothetical protein
MCSLLLSNSSEMLGGGCRRVIKQTGQNVNNHIWEMDVDIV